MASRKIVDTLPPLPSSLKSLSPYVLRADELRAKDPVMAYWCTYYAAQLGLDLKSHEEGARDYLLALITLLEGMKKELGANDAVDNEAAGAAYVENFALKVFAMADNEDRNGGSTRSTAKKFLAAANFLELLRVFEKSNNAQVNEEKVRYAKWKASDIAKAFREGRKPTPGSAENVTDDMPESLSTSAASATDSSSVRTPSDHSLDSGPVAQVIDSVAPHTPPRKQFLGGLEIPMPNPISPGTWSTVATPGSDDIGMPLSSTKFAFTSATNRWKGANDFDDSPSMAKGSRVVGLDNDVMGGGSSGTLPSASAPVDLPLKKVHFSPSVIGGLSSAGGSPPVSPEFMPRNYTLITSSLSSSPPSIKPHSQAGPTHTRGNLELEPTMAPLPDSSPSNSSRTSLEEHSSPGAGVRSGGSPPRNSNSKPSSSPPGAGGATLGSSPPGPVRFVAQPTVPLSQSRGRERRSSLSSRPSPPRATNPHLHPAPPPPPPSISSFTSTSTYVSASQPPIVSSKLSGSPDKAQAPGLSSTNHPPYNINVYGGVHAPYAAPPPAPAPVYATAPPPPLELTPSLIAKAQKHCRYAISSLEYEDAEQARKELRAALAVLGER